MNGGRFLLEALVLAAAAMTIIWMFIVIEAVMQGPPV